MKSLTEYINEKNWTDDVKTKWHPEEGLFTKKDPKYIADYLLKNSKDRKQAMSRLVFYMNRAGENLENKTVLNKVKFLLSESINEKLILTKDTFKNFAKQYDVNLLDKTFTNIEDLAIALNKYFGDDIKPIKVKYKEKIFRFSGLSSSRYSVNPHFCIEFNSTVNKKIDNGIQFGLLIFNNTLCSQLYYIYNKDQVSRLRLKGYDFKSNFLEWLTDPDPDDNPSRSKMMELFKIKDK